MNNLHPITCLYRDSVTGKMRILDFFCHPRYQVTARIVDSEKTKLRKAVNSNHFSVTRPETATCEDTTASPIHARCRLVIAGGDGTLFVIGSNP